MTSELKLFSLLSEQQKKGLLTDRNLILSAGAGAGKTSVLTARYLHLILSEKRSPARILAVTFTRNGADEMRNKILSEIRKLELNDESLRYQLMMGVARADIVTFDSLFLSLYAEFAPKAGFSPKIMLIEPVDKTSIMQEIHSEFMQMLNQTPDDPGKRFGSVPWNDIIESVQELVSSDKLIAVLNEAKAYSLTVSDLADVYFLKAFARLGLTFCQKFTWVSSVLCQPESPGFSQVTSHLKILAKELPDWFDLPEKIENEQDFWLKKLKELISGWELIRSLFPAPESQKQLDHHLSRLLSVEEAAPSLSQIQQFSAHHRLNFSRLATAFLTEYEIRKRKRHLADFSDVQNIVHGLIRNEMASGQNTVIEKLAGRYDQVLIDEFQDTNYQQWDTLKPFVWDFQNHRLFPARLFIVGDPKQSIFRFRNAQVSVFHDLQNLVRESNQSQNLTQIPGFTADEHDGVIGLTENFRSCQSVLGFVNSLFDEEFMRDGEGAVLDQQVDYSRMVPAKVFSEGEHPFNGKVRLIQAPKPDKILVLVNELSALVETISLGNDKYFDKTKDKIAVIASNNADLDVISTLLRQRNLPHRRSRGLNLLQTQEGADILNWVRFLANPDDDLAFIGLSKSPFLLLADESLMILKDKTKYASLWSLIKSENEKESHLLPNEQVKLKLFRIQAESWLKRKLSEAVTPILWDALTETGAWLAYNQQVNREQVVSNLTGLIDYMTRFESRNGGSVFDMTDFLENLRIEEEGLSEIPVISGTGLVSVDLLTVHKSKGLTYKYVLVLDDFKTQFSTTKDQFLPDFDWGLAIKGYTGSDYVTDEFFSAVNQKVQNELKAEANRVVYVALTRATHQTWLVGDFQVDENLVYNPQRKDKSWATRIMKRASELLALPDVEQDHGNVSWHPPEPLPWQSPGQTESQGDDQLFLNWLKNQQPSRPEPDAYFTNFTATGLMAANQCGTANRLKKIQANRLNSKAIAGMSASEKGSLIHLLLSIPENDWKKQSESWTSIPESEIEHIFSVCKTVLANPFIQKLKSGDQHHEIPFIVRMEGRHLQGSIDWLVRSGKEIWIVDYKTNKISSGQLSSLYGQYELQLKLYAWAVSQIFAEAETFHLVLFSTALDRETGKTWSRSEVESFKNEILQIIHQIENQEYDRDYQSVASYLCDECSFYQFCYRDELKQGQTID